MILTDWHQITDPTDPAYDAERPRWAASAAGYPVSTAAELLAIAGPDSRTAPAWTITRDASRFIAAPTN